MIDYIRARVIESPATYKILKYEMVVQQCNNCLYISKAHQLYGKTNTVLHSIMYDVINQIRHNQHYNDLLDPANAGQVLSGLIIINLFDIPIELSNAISPYENILRIRNSLFEIVLN